MWPVEKLHQHLRRHRRSITSVRDQVYLALGNLGPCPKVKVVEHFEGEVDRATIYRTLDLFLEIGVTQVVRYRLIELSDGFKQHHHHITCSRCHDEFGFNDERLEQVIARIAKNYELELTGHQVELLHVCAKCREQVAS